jgi:hypothetical protein
MPILHRAEAVFVGGLAASLTLAEAAGESATNPYQAIVERNLFSLKPSLAAQRAEPDHPPPPKITLTGITTIFRDKEVLMKVLMPGRPGESPKEQSFISAEGQQEGELRVLKVNEKTGDVTINDFGTVLTLNLDKDGAKLSDGQPPARPLPFGRVPSVSHLARVAPVHRPAGR